MAGPAKAERLVMSTSGLKCYTGRVNSFPEKNNPPMNPRTIRLLLILNTLTALGAAAWTLATPSEAGAARLLGYSYARLALAGVCLLLAAGLGGMAVLGRKA